MSGSASTAFVVFARQPLADARRRGWGQAGRALFRTPELPADLAADGMAVYHFRHGLARPRPGPGGERLRPQEGANFGQRLENCLETIAAEGYENVIVVGADCPGLSADDLRSAASALGSGRGALGPDDKGGCYLIALPLRLRGRLRGIPWGRNRDFALLRERLGAAPEAILPVRRDLDGPQDLRGVAREFAHAALARIAERLWRRLEPSIARATATSSPDAARDWIRFRLPDAQAPPRAAA